MLYQWSRLFGKWCLWSRFLATLQNRLLLLLEKDHLMQAHLDLPHMFHMFSKKSRQMFQKKKLLVGKWFFCFNLKREKLLTMQPFLGLRCWDRIQ